MSKSSEWRSDGSLLAALFVAALLAFGAITGSSESAEGRSAASNQTPVEPNASKLIEYFNAVGAATAVADSPDPTLAALLAP